MLRVSLETNNNITRSYLSKKEKFIKDFSQEEERQFEKNLIDYFKLLSSTNVNSSNTTPNFKNHLSTVEDSLKALDNYLTEEKSDEPDKEFDKIKISIAIKISALAKATPLFEKAMALLEKSTSESTEQFILELISVVKIIQDELTKDNVHFSADDFLPIFVAVLKCYLENNNRYDLVFVVKTIIEENINATTALNAELGYTSTTLLLAFSYVIDEKYNINKQKNRAGETLAKAAIKNSMDDIEKRISSTKCMESKQIAVLNYLLETIADAFCKPEIEGKTRFSIINAVQENLKQYIKKEGESDHFLPARFVEFIINFAKINPKLPHLVDSWKTILNNMIELYDNLLKEGLTSHDTIGRTASYKRFILSIVNKQYRKEEKNQNVSCEEKFSDEGISVDKISQNQMHEDIERQIIAKLLEGFVNSVSYPSSLFEKNKYYGNLNNLKEEPGCIEEVIAGLGEKIDHYPEFKLFYRQAIKLNYRAESEINEEISKNIIRENFSYITEIFPTSQSNHQPTFSFEDPLLKDIRAVVAKIASYINDKQMIMPSQSKKLCEILQKLLSAFEKTEAIKRNLIQSWVINACNQWIQKAIDKINILENQKNSNNNNFRQ